MRRAPLVLFAALAAAQTTPFGQGRPPVPSFAGAVEAWDRGAYVEALEGLRALLAGADEQTFARIALLTGELYETTEITRDGRAPALVGDRGLVMYEAVRGGVSLVRIVDPAAGNRVVAEFPGRNATASPDGRRVAYRTGANAAVWRDVETGGDTPIGAPGAIAAGVVWGDAGDELFFVASAQGDAGPHGIHAYTLAGGATRLLADTPAPAHGLRAVPGGTALLYSLGGGRTGQPAVHGYVDLRSGQTGTFDGALSQPAFSADGRTMAYAARAGETSTLFVYPWGEAPAEALTTGDPVDNPALSPDGTRVAFQRMPREDWEIFVLDRGSDTPVRVTREIQHDVLPRFLTGDRLLGLVGEPRHRRSYVYDLTSGATQRLFHNNTVRTIAPEYAWQTDASGTRVLVWADRDGDTVSPERGVYLVDLTRRVTREALDARLGAMLASERALRAFAARVTKPLAPAIRAVVGRASVSRVYGYGKDLYAFDSKHISQPGNLKAAEYLHATYASFGYAPEYQWFEPRDTEGNPRAFGGRTANVIATLKGTVHPEVIYVVSSHYDSVARGPGADDDSSGTAALLETARMLAGHPQPATIVFASFTGEEAGLLGSREFVRRTAEAGWNVAGALNNDMIGWANNHRLDDTIRYSNPGIRDIQHAVAMTFTDLITYDARYYRGTDAHAFYDAWGDIVGGIGSYPVLGNPHYHQVHDVLETINHQLVTEVAKTTAATLVMLTNAPARVRGVKVAAAGNNVAVTWEPSPERDVRRYIVEWTDAAGRAQRTEVTSAAATIRKPAAGSEIAVTAVNRRGLLSWDRARVRVP